MCNDNCSAWYTNSLDISSSSVADLFQCQRQIGIYHRWNVIGLAWSFLNVCQHGYNINVYVISFWREKKDFLTFSDSFINCKQKILNKLS